MKKEKSIFVTEGYLLREVMTFLTEGVGEISSKRKKIRKTFTWNCIAHENQ